MIFFLSITSKLKLGQNWSKIIFSEWSYSAGHLSIALHIYWWIAQTCFEHRVSLSLLLLLTVCEHTWYLSFFYTHNFWGLEILHSKVHKFATKIYSQQNSENYTLCVRIHTVQITHCVYNYTLSVKVHTVCKVLH